MLTNNVQTDINSDVIEDYIILSLLYDSDAPKYSKLDPNFCFYSASKFTVRK